MLYMCGDDYVLECWGLWSSDLSVSNHRRVELWDGIADVIYSVCAIRLRTFYKYVTVLSGSSSLVDGHRNFSCTFCKTSLPSLLFSRSATATLPTNHHVTPSPPSQITAALANADKLEKGEKWDKGLILPGTLDLDAFPLSDEKLGVVFEDEDMVSRCRLLELQRSRIG